MRAPAQEQDSSRELGADPRPLGAVCRVRKRRGGVVLEKPVPSRKIHRPGTGSAAGEASLNWPLPNLHIECSGAPTSPGKRHPSLVVGSGDAITCHS